MPLTEIDVLKAVSDPLLRQMNFSVDSVQVNGEAYQKIWQLIDDEQILVVAGNDPGEAHYNAKTDTIMTQKAEPPLDLFNRSVLIHECTHAIADMQFANITWLTNEATARIAQATYLLLSAPKPQIPAGYPSLSSHAIPLVKKFKLHTSAGNGAKLTQDDVFPLVRRINTETAYHKDHSIISASNGISKKDRKTVRLQLTSTEETGHKSQSHAKNYRVPGDALFAFNKHDIRPEAVPALEAAGAFIQQAMAAQPGFRVWIEGHTDNVGDPNYNVALSERRAQAVADWLIARKIVNASDVRPHGWGAARPVAPNTDESGRARNRRVEILLMD